jgi:nicotinic acid mononucleotide adenylyltransferase
MGPELPKTVAALSSTKVRLAAHSSAISSMVTPKVEKFIINEGLYRK